MKIMSVVGARPNFMKIAPFIRAVEKNNIDHILVHTGQHYDDKMSNSFFNDLNIPKPHINLEIGSGTHAEQVGNTMIQFERVLQIEEPDWVVVVGDVNATLACSVTAKKLGIKVCHIESGLRSGDETMPEEINRLVTDRISDLLLTPDLISAENLRKEGIKEKKIKFVGNIMIDTLMSNLEKSKKININEILQNNLIDGQIDKNFLNLDLYGLITMHRPSNVDNKDILKPIIEFLNSKIIPYPLIWPIHPRTKKQLIKFNLWDDLLNNKQLILLDPIGYHSIISLNSNSQIMLTDSGGIQEECTILGTPCVTLRWNTERPITLIENGGVSILVGNDIKTIKEGIKKILNMDMNIKVPKYWDGNVALRCVEEILKYKK